MSHLVGNRCASEQFLLSLIRNGLFHTCVQNFEAIHISCSIFCSGNEVGQEQWQAIIPALGKCTKLKSISDYEWSAQVLSDDLEVNLSRKGLNDKSAMAVLVGLLQREQATRITKLDLRSGRNKAAASTLWQGII